MRRHLEKKTRERREPAHKGQGGDEQGGQEERPIEVAFAHLLVTCVDEECHRGQEPEFVRGHEGEEAQEPCPAEANGSFVEETLVEIEGEEGAGLEHGIHAHREGDLALRVQTTEEQDRTESGRPVAKPREILVREQQGQEEQQERGETYPGRMTSEEGHGRGEQEQVERRTQILGA